MLIELGKYEKHYYGMKLPPSQSKCEKSTYHHSKPSSRVFVTVMRLYVEVHKFSWDAW